MFLIQEIDVLNTEVLQAIILEKELKLIDKKYFGELFTKKGMMSKEGERNENNYISSIRQLSSEEELD